MKDKNLTSLNMQELGDPMVIVISGKVSLVALQDTGKPHSVQVNSYGDSKLLSLGTLDNPRYSGVMKAVEDIANSEEDVQTFERNESGLPLVLYDPETRSYSIASFGRKYKPDSDSKLKVDYIGSFRVVKYEDRKELPLDVSTEVTEDLIALNRNLKNRQKEKSYHKRIRRKAA